MPVAHPCTTPAPERAAVFSGATRASLPTRQPSLSAVLWRILVLGCLAQQAPAIGSPPIREALSEGHLGLHEVGAFRRADGRCSDCAVAPQALFYFRDETVAVPTTGAPPGTRPSHDGVREDIGRWIRTADADFAGPPFLLRLGAPHIATGARLSADGTPLSFADGSSAAFGIVSRIATNQAYYDASTTRHFAGRPLRLRGESRQAPDGTRRFVARTLWPEDQRIVPASLPVSALPAGQALATLIAADGGGARSVQPRVRPRAGRELRRVHGAGAGRPQGLEDHPRRTMALPRIAAGPPTRRRRTAGRHRRHTRVLGAGAGGRAAVGGVEALAQSSTVRQDVLTHAGSSTCSVVRTTRSFTCAR